MERRVECLHVESISYVMSTSSVMCELGLVLKFHEVNRYMFPYRINSRDNVDIDSVHLLSPILLILKFHEVNLYKFP